MAERQPEYTGPSRLELILLFLAIGGAVAGGLFAFGILPPDFGSEDPASSPRIAQQASPQGPTPSSAPTPAPQPSPTLEQTALPTPTLTPSPPVTPAPTLKATPTPTATKIPLATSEPAAAATAASTPTIAPTATPAPTATATPAPTATATPAPVFDGIYTLTVEQPPEATYAGKVISFKIGDLTASETAIWRQGQTMELDLRASRSAFSPKPSGSNLAKGYPQSLGGGLLASPLTQPAPPSVFQGTATVDGVPVPQGTIVTAWMEATEVGSTSVVLRPAIPDSLSGAGAFFSPLGNTLRRVWSYDAPIRFWLFYDPRTAFAATHTLTEVQSGEIVWIDVSEDVEFKGLSLFEGWNLVGLP